MNEFITKEVGKILEGTEYKGSHGMAMASAWIMGNMKGLYLKVLQVEKSALADYFVIASASNFIQATSMADEVLRQFKKFGILAKSIEGDSESDWILLDLGDVIVHIFLEQSRDLYKLEELWEDAVEMDIPQEYYSPSDVAEFDTGKSDTDYF